jgi:hypothetical protein
MKKKKFSQIWASQTNIGKQYGISGIAVGKILIEHGLRDPVTKIATEISLSEGWCTATPMKDGILHYMWNIEKVCAILVNKEVKKITMSEKIANEIVLTIKSANRSIDHGGDKFGFWALELAFDQVPKKMTSEVATELTKKGYKEYVDGWMK